MAQTRKQGTALPVFGHETTTNITFDAGRARRYADNPENEAQREPPWEL
jgi:hypothetical protein